MPRPPCSTLFPYTTLFRSGQRAPSLRTQLPAGLSDREVEVLQLISTGTTMKVAAARLHVSVKTIDAHIQHIYDKTGCSTRAGARSEEHTSELQSRFDLVCR